MEYAFNIHIVTLTSLCCCPFCCCFFFFVYIRFLRDRINKRGNFCTVRWFLIQYFVCHCFFFCSSFTQTDDVSRSDFGVFGPNLFHVSEKKRPIYLWTILIFFSTKFHWNFFIAFRLKFIFVGLNEIHHSFRSIIFFVWNSRKNAVMSFTETVFMHNYLWSLFHSCFSYFPFFMFLFLSYLSLAKCMYFQKDSFAKGWNVQHEIYFIQTIGDVNKHNKNVTIFIFQWEFSPLQLKNDVPTDFVFKKCSQSFKCFINCIHNLIQHFKHSMHSCTIKQYGKMKISFHNYFFNWTENRSRLLRFSHRRKFSMPREFDGEFIFNKKHFNLIRQIHSLNFVFLMEELQQEHLRETKTSWCELKLNVNSVVFFSFFFGYFMNKMNII